MPLEISPVLAGTYDAPDYVPPHNVASTQTDDAAGDTSAIDSRRYTKFDRSAVDAGNTTTFSFSDFIDMINPLEHIPVISSVYREVTGDVINPVSRVVGDILYGGVMGIASAVVGGLSAAADSVFETETGKDSTGNVVASLFESDKPNSSTPTTQLAQNGNTATAPLTQTAAATSAQINARAKLQAAATVAATSSAVAASMPSTGPSAMPSMGSSSGITSAAQLASAMSGGGLNGNPLSGDPATALALNGPKSFALDPKKLPYGGVMDPGALQGTNMAVSLANSAPGLQMNHMVYTGRLKNGVKPSPVAAATAATTPAATDTNSTYASTSGPNALPPSLLDDIAALRAINQYRSTASKGMPAGMTMDVVN